MASWEQRQPQAAQPQPQPPQLTQADRERIARNREAALERRRQAQQNMPSLSPPAAYQPPLQQNYNNWYANGPQPVAQPAWGPRNSQPPAFRPQQQWSNPPAPPSSYAPPSYNATSIAPSAGNFVSRPAAPSVASVFFSPAAPQTIRPAWGYQVNSTPGFQAPPAPWVQHTPMYGNGNPFAPSQPQAPLPGPSQAPLQAPSQQPFPIATKRSSSPVNSDSSNFVHKNGPMKKIVLSENKKYGASSTYTFAAKPDPALASKKLSQATLGQTVKRYRAAKHNEDSYVAPAPSEQPFDFNVVLPSKPALQLATPASEGPHTLFTATQFRAGGGSGLSSFWQSRSATPFSFQAAQGLAPTPSHRSPGPAKTATTKLRARSLLCGPEDPNTPDSLAQKRWLWLQNRRDATGKYPADQAYDSRTILIPPEEFSRLKGFNAQYWSIKRDAMDLVLFVRVGSFYELYDLDADIGLRVGLNPMDGPSRSSRDANMWKVGCSAGAFLQWARRVLALGYSVGRVEECRSSKGDVVEHTVARQLVPRKLVQIYTPGTLLDAALPAASSSAGAAAAAPNHSFDDGTASQPFIALFEGSNGLLGCCIVDVDVATVALSEWQEVDVNRSIFSTLLTQANPCEVLILGPAFLSAETRKVLKRHKPLVANGIERPLAVSLLRRFELLFDPEDPNQVPALLERVESAYFNHGGKESSFQAAAESLCMVPHAATAFLMAIAHLHLAGVASHVLPHATISSLASFTPQGARITGHMLLDSTSIGSLELVEGGLGGVKGSLLSYLAAGASTAAGRRRIREWLLSPLYRVGDINERLDVVSAFMQLPEALGAFQKTLLSLQAPDCERLMPKVATLLADISSSHGGSMATDDGDTPAAGTRTRTSLSTARFRSAAKLFAGLGLMMEAVSQLQQAVDFQRIGGAAALPPLDRALRYGSEITQALNTLQGLFHHSRFAAGEEDGLTLQPGLCPNYDAAVSEVSATLAELEDVVELERKALGAASPPVNPTVLRKVRLVEVSGELVLEVPISLKSRISRLHSVVKETKTVVRVSVAAATTAAAKLAIAKDAGEDAVLCYLAQSANLFLENYQSFLGFCTCVASLDALSAFAERTHPQNAALGCTFCRPMFSANATAEDQSPPLLNLQGLWNPQLLLSECRSSNVIKIQPTDLVLGVEGSTSSTLLLTGANTGGKSTLLRSACIAVILAQVGAYVPCSSCELAPVDRILLRMGAQDRIAAGESTFCVEMTETSAVLRHAQPSSLVVLDELGRGTSTHDGNAIAAAVAWWLTINPRCRVLFATHYHGLTRDQDILAAGAILGHMSSSVNENGLIPSYKLMPGAAPEGSCGLAVAKTVGLPVTVVQRAEQIAARMEREGNTALSKLHIRVVFLLRDVAQGKIVKSGAIIEAQTAIRAALLMEL